MTKQRRKPLHIDDLIHEKSGITVPIYLSVSGQSFQATLPNDKTIGSKTREDLDKEIVKWLDENTILEWLPVIQVDEYVQDYGGIGENMIGFEITRQYYAKKKSGAGMMYKHWEPTENGSEPAWDAKWGFEAKDFNPPCHTEGFRKTTFYLPYTEETWEELQKLQGTLADLKKLLRHLLGSGEGLYRLRNNLLAAILPQLNEIPVKKEDFEI